MNCEPTPKSLILCKNLKLKVEGLNLRADQGVASKCSEDSGATKIGTQLETLNFEL